MTQGDLILIRAIDRALLAHPFVCPLPIVLGRGTIHLPRAVARALSTRLQQMQRDQREAVRQRGEMVAVG